MYPATRRQPASSNVGNWGQGLLSMGGGSKTHRISLFPRGHLPVRDTWGWVLAVCLFFLHAAIGTCAASSTAGGSGSGSGAFQRFSYEITNTR